MVKDCPGCPQARVLTTIRAMRVTVDTDLCEANAVCQSLVPEVFSVDESDALTIMVSEVPPELAERVRRAVASCPKMALQLED
jgi:ferredoxin